jgi:hypothetical protein
LVAQVEVVVDTLLTPITHIKEPMAGRKMVRLVVVARGAHRKALLEPQGALTLLAVAVAVGVTLRRLVLAVLVVLPQGVVVAGVLPTVLILARVAQVVMVLFASTLGKELTWQTDMQLWKTGLLPT